MIKTYISRPLYLDKLRPYLNKDVNDWWNTSRTISEAWSRRKRSVTFSSRSGKEIDFVCEKRGDRLYVQTAYIMPDKKTRDREFGNLLEIKDNFRKVVVSMDRMIEGGYKGIEHISVADFLHNE